MNATLYAAPSESKMGKNEYIYTPSGISSDPVLHEKIDKLTEVLNKILAEMKRHNNNVEKHRDKHKG